MLKSLLQNWLTQILGPISGDSVSVGLDGGGGRTVMYDKLPDNVYDRVQDPLPPNIAPWHADYLKRKEYEKIMEAQRSLYFSEQIIKIPL